MIENIRKYTGLIFVVIVVLVLGFILMGSSDILRRNAGGGGGGDFIQIDGRNYSQVDFNKAGLNSLNLAQSLRSYDTNGFEVMQFASTLAANAQSQGQEMAAKNFFASRIILREAFDEFGIQPSQEKIDEFIQGLSTFQVRPTPGSPPGATTGEFDQIAYNNFIDNFIGRYGLKESELRDLISDVIATSELRDIIGGGLTVSRDIAEVTSIVNSQKVEVIASPIEIETFRKAIEPSDEQLKEFWEVVKDGYMTEQRIKVSYFLASPADPEESAADKEDAAAEEESEDKEDSTEESEEAESKEAEEAKKEEAKAQAEKKLAIKVNTFSDLLIGSEGADFESLVEKNGWELTSSDWFTRGTMPEPLKVKTRGTSMGKTLADQLFSLTAGPDSLAPFTDPVAVGTNQWLTARLDELEPPRVKTFEEAKEEITKRYIEEKADEALKTHVEEKIAAIEEALGADKSYSDAAKDAGLEAKELGPFGPSDTLSDGFRASELFTPASTINPGALTEPIYSETQAIILFVKNRQIVKDDNRGQQVDSTMSRLAADISNRAFDAWLTQRIAQAEVRDLTRRP